jgi:hypothetical protein
MGIQMSFYKETRLIPLAVIFLKKSITTELTKNLPGCSEHKSSLPYETHVNITFRPQTLYSRQLFQTVIL